MRTAPHRTRGTLAAALVALPLLGACAVSPAAPPSATALGPEQAVELVAEWARRWAAFTGLRAAVDLRVTKRGLAQRTAGVVLVSPTHLRFEAVPPVGLPSLVLVAGPERVTAFSPGEGKAWAGPASPEALARWLGVPVTTEMLVRLLSGHVPVPITPGRFRLVAADVPYLALEGPPLRQDVWVTRGGHPARAALGGTVDLVATYEWATGGVLQSLAVEVPEQSLRFHLRYISVEPVTPPADAFELVLPPWVPVLPAN